jgi:hypothetical protein
MSTADGTDYIQHAAASRPEPTATEQMMPAVGPGLYMQMLLQLLQVQPSAPSGNRHADKPETNYSPLHIQQPE